MINTNLQYWRNIYSEVSEKVLLNKSIRHKLLSLIISHENSSANDN